MNSFVTSLPEFTVGCRRRKLRVGNDVRVERRRAKRAKKMGGSKEDFEAAVKAY
jgi:hypothetical protein